MNNKFVKKLCKVNNPKKLVLLIQKLNMAQINNILKKRINDADKKIPDASELVQRTDYNAKTTEIEGKIHRISVLASSAALAEVEKKNI